MEVPVVPIIYSQSGAALWSWAEFLDVIILMTYQEIPGTMPRMPELISQEEILDAAKYWLSPGRAGGASMSTYKCGHIGPTGPTMCKRCCIEGLCKIIEVRGK